MAEPINKTKCFPFEIAKWENEKEINGNKIKTHSFTIQKSIAKKNGSETTWEHQKITVFPEEIMKLSFALAKTYEEHFVE